ncbi:MAG: hypothetical protein HZB52_02860, partial [Chloroflexi bacterium]|nr:hypothetical protein [Chloroflexota bacterium]
MERHLIKVFGVIFALALAACTATLGENNKLTPSTQKTDSPLTAAKPSNGTLVPTISLTAAQAASTPLAT